MESANSGSIQSSSGGDEEFDSRPGPTGTTTDPLLSFFQPNSSTNTSTGTGTANLPFYSLSDFSPSPLLPFEPTTTNMPTSHHHRSFMPSPPSFTLNTPQTLINTPSSSSPSAPTGSTQAASGGGGGGPQRSSRKRTRASRRAPTTVLTTDTSNFRAMVQEFTGIPSPPFAPSPLVRSRFDHHLFSSGSASSLPPYLLRPFAQKLNTSTGMVSNTASSADGGSVPVTTNMAGTGTGTSNLSQVQQASDHQAQAMLNMQNPMLNFQSLLQSQSQSQHLQPNNARSLLNFASRSVPQSMHGSNEFVGTSNLQRGLIGSDGQQLHQQGGWIGTGSGSSTRRESNQLSSVVGTERMASTSCSDFVNVSKEQETNVVAPRGEGMVDSWLCSSSSDR